MTPSCPACGAPATDGLTVRYQYPRDVFVPEAVDPWNVHGSAPLRTCGSVPCEAAGLLAVLDEIITHTALASGHLLSPGDLRVNGVGRPEDFTYSVIDPDEAS